MINCFNLKLNQTVLRFTRLLKLAAMPFFVRLNFTAKGDANKSGTSPAKLGSGTTSITSITSATYGNLLSVEIRLIRAMDDAVVRKHRVEEGERVTRDSVEWWRCPVDKSGKLVVHPGEHCVDKFMPYPYQKEGKSPHATGVTWSSATVTPYGEGAYTDERRRNRKIAICKRFLFILFLLLLLILNLAALVWSALVAMFWREGEIPLTIPFRFPSIPYYTITIEDK